MNLPPLWAVIAAIAFGYLVAASGDNGSGARQRPHIERTHNGKIQAQIHGG